ncbi:MAG TPA: hypothetical protein PL143_16470 [Rhodocyclaceae bacterium]|nr:hypothetical protein [Rhodocyclaceae bacterium]
MNRRIHTLTAVAALMLTATAMAVDDAGTLDQGGYKLEAGWSKDGRERGWEAAAGFAPIDKLELELAHGQARDRSTSPHVRLDGVGFAAKWVPLQQDTGLSAGVKLEYGRVRVDERADGKHTAHARALAGLASWRFASGQIAHLNLGREWLRHRGEREAANTWGVGFEQPLVETVQLTLELFGAEHSRPDRQIGVRWEVAEGLKLSAAVGRGNDHSFGNAGIAWEF